jgi:hypothetical protein
MKPGNNKEISPKKKGFLGIQLELNSSNPRPSFHSTILYRETKKDLKNLRWSRGCVQQRMN